MIQSIYWESKNLFQSKSQFFLFFLPTLVCLFTYFYFTVFTHVFFTLNESHPGRSSLCNNISREKELVVALELQTNLSKFYIGLAEESLQYRLHCDFLPSESVKYH